MQMFEIGSDEKCPLDYSILSVMKDVSTFEQASVMGNYLSELM